MSPVDSISGNAGYTPVTQSISVVQPTGSRNADSRDGSLPKATGAADSGTATANRRPADQVTLSGRKPDSVNRDLQASGADASKQEPKQGEKTTPDGKSLEDPQVQQQIARLKQIEAKVKAHEAAHKAAGGNLASSASYGYTQGPDGRSYVTSGEVQIDMSTGKTPDETVSRMQQVIRAALAPSDPSGQDRAVAAQAATQMTQAQQEKSRLESPSAKPDPTRPVDPAAEAVTEATNPIAAKEKKTGQAASNRTDTRIQQAYGNPAVQGGDRTNTNNNVGIKRSSPVGQFNNSTQSGVYSLISAFA